MPSFWTSASICGPLSIIWMRGPEALLAGHGQLARVVEEDGVRDVLLGGRREVREGRDRDDDDAVGGAEGGVDLALVGPLREGRGVDDGAVGLRRGDRIGVAGRAGAPPAAPRGERERRERAGGGKGGGPSRDQECSRHARLRVAFGVGAAEDAARWMTARVPARPCQISGTQVRGNDPNDAEAPSGTDRFSRDESESGRRSGTRSRARALGHPRARGTPPVASRQRTAVREGRPWGSSRLDEASADRGLALM